MSGVELTVELVRKTYEDGRVVALDGVSLRAGAGEFVAVTGPSGCGKSTLLNLVGALDRPDSGAILVGGQRVDELRDPAEYRAATVGFVFQFHNLVPVLSAVENVQVPMIGRGRSRAERERRARELLAEVGLAHRATSRPPRSRAASASASRSPARSRTSRGSSSPTSRRAPSTPRPRPRCSRSSAASKPSAGRRCSW